MLEPLLLVESSCVISLLSLKLLVGDVCLAAAQKPSIEEEK